MRKIGVIKPYRFNDHLIIGISKRWLSICEELSFQVFFDDQKRLCIISKKCLKI